MQRLGDSKAVCPGWVPGILTRGSWATGTGDQAETLTVLMETIKKMMPRLVNRIGRGYFLQRIKRSFNLIGRAFPLNRLEDISVWGISGNKGRAAIGGITINERIGWDCVTSMTPLSETGFECRRCSRYVLRRDLI